MPRAYTEARRAYNAAYFAAHRDERRARDATYYATHREEWRLYGTAYYAAHRAEKREAGIRWRAANRERKAAYMSIYRRAHLAEYAQRQANRRARQAGAPGSASLVQTKARWAMWGDRCWMCAAPATATDHVKPLAKGGPNWPANLRPACAPCNTRKRDQWPYQPTRSKEL